MYLLPVGIFGFTISIPCAFSFLSDAMQLEIEENLLLAVLLEVFSSVAFLFDVVHGFLSCLRIRSDVTVQDICLPLLRLDATLL